jgi:hypothetical protein
MRSSLRSMILLSWNESSRFLSSSSLATFSGEERDSAHTVQFGFAQIIELYQSSLLAHRPHHDAALALALPTTSPVLSSRILPVSRRHEP